MAVFRGEGKPLIQLQQRANSLRLATRLFPNRFSCMANRNKPGYRSPKQDRCQSLTVRLPREINEAMTEATMRAGTTKQDAIEEFCVRFTREHGVKIPSRAA